MRRELTVDFNEELDDGLLLAHDRDATPGTQIGVGARLVVGDHDAGICVAEVIEYDAATGLVTLRLLDEQLSDEPTGPATRQR